MTKHSLPRKIFGTDGVRGCANEGWLAPNNIMKLAQAAGAHFINGDHKHRVVIGKDTRLSGYMIEPALTAGFISMGMDVILVGPMPTPAIAMLTRSLRADLGVMISASHNPYEDNGLKFFDACGLKLPDAVEHKIEEMFFSDLIPHVTHDKLGRAQRLDDAQGRYIEYLKNSFPKNQTLEGLHIVLDCANGAAYKIAPTVLWELGAHVTTINAHPSGININEKSGATNTKLLEHEVVALGADIGIALDGDADRVIFVDEKGKAVHGDHLLGAIATSWQKTNRLQSPKIAGTVMCNRGLESYLKSLSLDLIRTPVGDRYVSKHMLNDNINLGGEPSGHVIMSDYTTTGDGVLCALQLLSHLIATNQKASSLQDIFDLYPEALVNIECSDKSFVNTQAFQNDCLDLEKAFSDQTYMLIRPSGTENLIRIMVQAPTEKLLQQALKHAQDLVEKHLPITAASKN